MPFHAPTLALEVVLSVVDVTTATEVVEALRHAPALLHALGDAVADVQARFAREVLPGLRQAHEDAKRNKSMIYDAGDPAIDHPNIALRALKYLSMATVDSEVHVESAHVLVDCFQFLDPYEFEYRDEFILNSIRSCGFHRTLVRRIAAFGDDTSSDLYESHTRLLCTMIKNGYLGPRCRPWTYHQIVQDFDCDCLEALLLNSLQHSSYNDASRSTWFYALKCLCTLMYHGSVDIDEPAYNGANCIEFLNREDTRARLRCDSIANYSVPYFVENMLSLHNEGMFDILLQNVGLMNQNYNRECIVILEILFVICPPCRGAVFGAICRNIEKIQKKNKDIYYLFSKFGLSRSPSSSLMRHFIIEAFIK